ncbi:MAG: UbiA family prenyltransferase [Candidatus Sulfotelmatobacter sp.]
MATAPILILSTPPAVSRLAALSNYWALTKPEVNFLIAIATFTGFYLAFPGPLAQFPWLLLVHTLLGTLLVASGTGTLNQYIERRFDAQMRRTARRPLAAGQAEEQRRRAQPCLDSGRTASGSRPSKFRGWREKRACGPEAYKMFRRSCRRA